MYSFIYQQNTLYGVVRILLSAKVTCFNTYNSLKYVLFTKYFFFIIVIIIYLCAFDFSLFFWSVFINIVCAFLHYIQLWCDADVWMEQI